jgi:hypothetical protein
MRFCDRRAGGHDSIDRRDQQTIAQPSEYAPNERAPVSGPLQRGMALAALVEDVACELEDATIRVTSPPTS